MKASFTLVRPFYWEEFLFTSCETFLRRHGAMPHTVTINPFAYFLLEMAIKKAEEPQARALRHFDNSGNPKEYAENDPFAITYFEIDDHILHLRVSQDQNLGYRTYLLEADDLEESSVMQELGELLLEAGMC